MLSVYVVLGTIYLVYLGTYVLFVKHYIQEHAEEPRISERVRDPGM